MNEHETERALQRMEQRMEEELRRLEEAERERLGLQRTEHWRDEMIDPTFTASQRPHTTLLLGGLTMAHDRLVEGALRGIGYRVRALPVPDEEALRYGKEYGNRAQCNPTYFTVGNLVKELCRLRDEEGLSPEQIVDRYVFLTAGACGPCRFGMYATEYRKALRDAGFDGFRVLLFQQAGGVKQATGEELGLVLGPRFFFAIARALFAGDVINLSAYRIRPYETEPGATDRAIEAVKDECYSALAEGRSILWALRRARRHLEAVPVDRSRPKPKVALIGEFWAMTTEGDGNYRLQRFLESEGAEVAITPLVNTILYNIWEYRHDTLARLEQRGADGGRFGLKDTDVGLTMAGLWLGEIALRATVYSFAWALGLRGYRLPVMEEYEEAAKEHYHVELRGGEGHLEVAKFIVNAKKAKAHLTLSVKPFGCMPSSGVSDGVQSAMAERFPQSLFLAVETSGEGAVNFYSRVQMVLFKARERARAEFEAALREEGIDAERFAAFLRGPGRRYTAPLYAPLHRHAGTAADLVREVAPLVRSRGVARWWRARGLQVRRLRERHLRERWHRLARYRAMLPWMPALLRFGFESGLDTVPALRRAYDRALDELVGRQQAARAASMWAKASPPSPVAAEVASAAE